MAEIQGLAAGLITLGMLLGAFLWQMVRMALDAGKSWVVAADEAGNVAQVARKKIKGNSFKMKLQGLPSEIRLPSPVQKRGGLQRWKYSGKRGGVVLIDSDGYPFRAPVRGDGGNVERAQVNAHHYWALGKSRLAQKYRMAQDGGALDWGRIAPWGFAAIGVLLLFIAWSVQKLGAGVA